MICVECKKLGLKSKIYPGVTSTTTVYYQPWYDEDGSYHNHDANIVTQSGGCSNGHYFTIQIPNTCPNCDWVQRID